MSVILKVNNISKQYRLGTVGTGSLQHDLNRWWHKLQGKEDPYLKLGAVNDRSSRATEDYVWALRDINFEVKEGEILGIIGKNGAGKSTLLKILSRVTSPTTGKVRTRGRIASLLEVGTGFHGELTGRENIFMNGAVLGMTRKEIRSKLDQIIAFSGCEKYIDTPVKRYSSGMTVRLGFAVAAHLEPEILVVDEVLAVGDAEFQKKAIGKMKDISRGEGRTVLFVSHNMAAIKSLCTRALMLEHGELVFEGNTDEVVQFYLKEGSNSFNNFRSFQDVGIDSIFELHSIGIKNKSKRFQDPITEDDIIEVVTLINLKVEKPENYHITYHLNNEYGDPIFSFTHSRGTPVDLKQGRNLLKCYFPKGFLQSGNFSLGFYFVEEKKKSIFVDKALHFFTVVDGSRELGVYMGREPGNIKPDFSWVNFIEHD